MPPEIVGNNFIPSIESELKNTVAWVKRSDQEDLFHILAYHMGWEGQGSGPNTRGKRIRPLLVLLTASSSGGEMERALPAAAAVELVHNFSLIHDDIQDESPLRHGRPTVWKLWGVAQAINAGDAMYTLAYMALLRLELTTSPEIALQASRILQETCLSLTQGQFLDVSYETRDDLTVDEYWPMVNGKTASLLGACTELGALVVNSNDEVRDSYRKFGQLLGLAFQIYDDILGIWGDQALTGKSIESDLITGKKTLPVLFGLSLDGPFANRWRRGNITMGEVPALARQLELEGARSYTEEQAHNLTDQALIALNSAHPVGDSGDELAKLALWLLGRRT